MKIIRKLILPVIVLAILFTASLFYYVEIYGKKIAQNQATQIAAEKITNDVYINFASEVYDKIKENYWDKITDEQLSNLYKLAAEKTTGSPAPTDPKTKDEVKNMLSQIMKDYDNAKKKDFVTKLSDIVLYNLKPAGRSRLYTEKQETNLKNTVENKDPSTDLYAVLGLTKNADTKEVDKAYQEKLKTLKEDKSPDAANKLTQANRAYAALSAPDTKATYDQSGAEPTVISKLLTPDIFYIKLIKFSPASFDELKKAADSIDPKKTNGPTTLIFDLRGNIGGAIDILQYFLGPFIGPNNYAYDFFHQGDATPYKTKYGWFDSLVRYKKTIVLIDGQSQSSAEVMAATLKKYNVGILIGAPTKGWGTVEQVVPLSHQIDANEKFSVFVVNSLTLRDDGQPIEGKGVDPTINIKDKDWQKKLMAYYNYPELARVIANLFN